MNMSIRAKLFFTLLLACVLVLLGTQAFVHWSLQQGLIELVDAREQERIKQIAIHLVEIYSSDDSWKPLSENSRLWVATLIGHNGRHFPPMGPGVGGGPPPPPSERLAQWLRRPPTESGLWPPQQTLPEVIERNHPVPLELRLMLLDADGNIVYGRKELLPEATLIPLQKDDQVIGALAILPGRPVVEMAELHFSSRLGNRLWIIAFAMLLISAVLAFPLSRRLVRPVRRFQETARRLATGDFSARVQTCGTDEIARLGRDINALAAALESNEQARRRWVADISHELRTPITLLRAELEALQDGVRPMSATAIDALHGDTMRLSRLVDDLYELSTTDMGALGYRFQDVDVAEILHGDVDAFRTQFADAGLGIELSGFPNEPVMFHADDQRLSQLFRNIIRNTLQYTDRGGRMRVVLTVHPTELHIDFHDTAPSVADKDLSRLFERLYRVDASRNRHTGGAGLGLAIAQNVVSAHNGRITAAPSPLGGLWIHIEFPL